MKYVTVEAVFNKNASTILPLAGFHSTVLYLVYNDMKKNRTFFDYSDNYDNRNSD